MDRTGCLAGVVKQRASRVALIRENQLLYRDRVHIRPLIPDDRSAWDPLWQGYLIFYKVEISPEITDLTWERFGDPAEAVFAIGAFSEGKLAGFAHYLFHRSTWSDGPYCYLEDLFVEPEMRGSGIGRLLIEAVAEAARETGATQLYWLTHESNKQAMSLYDRIARRSGFVHYQKPL